MFNLLFSCSRENVKPRKKQLIDSKQQVIRYCNSSILSRRDINDAIILPSGEDLNEWLAAKCKFIIDIFSDVLAAEYFVASL